MVALDVLKGVRADQAFLTKVTKNQKTVLRDLFYT